MNDSKRIYAMGAGIAAVILVIALALSVMSNQKTSSLPTAAPAQVSRPSARVTMPPAVKPLNTQVRQVVTIPQTSVKQTVTIKKH